MSDPLREIQDLGVDSISDLILEALEIENKIRKVSNASAALAEAGTVFDIANPLSGEMKRIRGKLNDQHRLLLDRSRQIDMIVASISDVAERMKREEQNE